MTETIIARLLDPTEIILENWVEIRPCTCCRARLVLPVDEVGLLVQCPKCARTSRALPAAGPFANLSIERYTVLQTGSENGSHVITDPLVSQPIAPFVPVRKQVLIEDRSAMVESVSVLQWVAALSLMFVSLNQAYIYWSAVELPESHERTTVTIFGFSLLTSALFFIAGNGIRLRSWFGWGLSMICSALTTAAMGLILYQRVMGRTGNFSDYHWGILFSLPALMCSIVSLVILSTPRYLGEFKQAA